MTADFRSLLFCIVGKEHLRRVALPAICPAMYPAEVSIPTWRLNDSTFNPLTHGLFEVRYLTACGLNCPQICGRICPQPWEIACLKRNWGGGGYSGGWGERCYSYWPPPHHDLCDTHKNRRKSARSAKPHGFLDLKTWLKLNFSQYIVKRTWTELSKSVEKFKIASLEAELQLSKLRLK